MCTVTFIPVNDTVFITHNRDENQVRPPAIPPRFHQVNGYKLLFPKDKKAGGTWIAINENGNAAVLLNGAFIKHTPATPYRKSRGLIFLEILAANDFLTAWRSLNLQDIEPFTFIVWSNAQLFETRWDGSRKYATKLNAKESHLWASVTLYDNKALTKRRRWFEEWQEAHPVPSMADIIYFHLHAGEGDTRNDLYMNRDGLILTVSVTSMQITTEKGLMSYLDLQDSSDSQQEIKFLKDPVEIQ